jgi:hypothetical protein
MKTPSLRHVRLPHVLIYSVVILAGCLNQPKSVQTDPAVDAYKAPGESFKDDIKDNADAMFADGQKIFRHDTFGSEAFWGDQLRLHQAIAGEKLGGVGPGLTAKQALELGLKVDVAKLPNILIEAIKGGSVSLEKPETTVELLKADAVVGVKAIEDGGRIRSVGITCALCHSTVDDRFAKGIGRRLDGWPNRDLNIGAIVALAPNLKPFTRYATTGRSHGEEGLGQLGSGEIRRGVGQGREGISAGREIRRDGLAGGVRLGRPEHAHLYRMG